MEYQTAEDVIKELGFYSPRDKPQTIEELEVLYKDGFTPAMKKIPSIEEINKGLFARMITPGFDKVLIDEAMELIGITFPREVVENRTKHPWYVEAMEIIKGIPYKIEESEGFEKNHTIEASASFIYTHEDFPEKAISLFNFYRYPTANPDCYWAGRWVTHPEFRGRARDFLSIVDHMYSSILKQEGMEKVFMFTEDDEVNEKTKKMYEKSFFEPTPLAIDYLGNEQRVYTQDISETSDFVNQMRTLRKRMGLQNK